MISLKRAIRTDEVQSELEAQKQLLDAAIVAYTSAIEGVREHALRACPPLIEPFAKDLQQLLEAVGPPCGVSQLATSRRALLDTLARFGNEAGRDYVAMATDIQEMIRLAVSATGSLEDHSTRGAAEMTKFASAFESISTLDNVVELRRRLRSEVQHMHDCLEKMARDDAQMIQKLQGEMRTLQKRLQQLKQSASIDSLTQLPNRKGLEECAAARLKEQQRFCVLCFSIDRCAQINERFGRSAGDAVLREFGRRLTASIRTTDVAGRWGGVEFLILMECSLQDAMARLRQISQKVCGRYEVSSDGRDVRIEVSAASSIAENLPGETLERLVIRMQAAYGR